MRDEFYEGIILWSVAGLALAAAFFSAFFIIRALLEKAESAAHQDYFFPGLPPSKWAELSFGKVHYTDSGRGPCLLLIHGIGASIYCWRLLIPLLEKHYRVIALDLPGFGLSQKKFDLDYGLDTQTERIEEFLKYLKVTKTDVVGSSMGGLLGLWLAFKNPQLVGRYVGLSPALYPRILPFNPAMLSIFSNWTSTHFNETWMRRMLSRVLYTYKDVTDESVQAYLYPYRHQPDAVKIFIKALATVRDRRIPHHLKTIATPILLLHGENDKIIPVKISRSALKHLPAANLKVLANAGHHIQEDNAEWVAEKIMSFCSNASTR